MTVVPTTSGDLHIDLCVETMDLPLRNDESTDDTYQYSEKPHHTREQCGAGAFTVVLPSVVLVSRILLAERYRVNITTSFTVFFTT